MNHKLNLMYEPPQPFQCKKEDAVRLHTELIQQFRIPFLLRYGMAEADDEPPVKPLRPVPVVLWYAVAGKQQPCAGLEGERVLVLFLHDQVILAHERLEDAVVVDVLRWQVGEDVRQLAEEFRSLETLVQCLP